MLVLTYFIFSKSHHPMTGGLPCACCTQIPTTAEKMFRNDDKAYYSIDWRDNGGRYCSENCRKRHRQRKTRDAMNLRTTTRHSEKNRKTQTYSPKCLCGGGVSISQKHHKHQIMKSNTPTSFRAMDHVIVELAQAPF